MTDESRAVNHYIENLNKKMEDLDDHNEANNHLGDCGKSPDFSLRDDWQNDSSYNDSHDIDQIEE